MEKFKEELNSKINKYARRCELEQKDDCIFTKSYIINELTDICAEAYKIDNAAMAMKIGTVISNLVSSLVVFPSSTRWSSDDMMYIYNNIQSYVEYINTNDSNDDIDRAIDKLFEED